MSLSRHPRRHWIAAPLFALFLLAPEVHAQNGTWTGAGIDGLWSDTGNWTSGTLPTTGTVSFNAGVTNTGNLNTFNDNNSTITSILVGAITSTAGTTPVTIGGNALTLSGATGINMTGATQDLTINTDLSNSATAQGWTNVSGRNITIGVLGTNNLFLSNTTTSHTLTLTVSSTSGTVTLNSVIADSSASGAAASNFAVASSGTSTTGATIQINGANTYTGTTNLNGRATIYQIGSDSAFGIGGTISTPLNGNVPFFQSVNGNHTISNPINFSGGFDFSGSNNLTFTGQLTGAAVHTIAYSGAAGTLLTMGPITLGTSGVAAGTFITGVTAPAPSTATSTLVFNGVIAEATGVTSGLIISLVNGTSSTIFSSDQFNAQNTFTGGINATGVGATITAGSSSNFGATPPSGPFGTGTVTISNTSVLPRLQAANGAQSVANNFTLTSSLQVQGTNNLTLSGVLSGAGGIQKIGSGTLNLTGNSNTFSSSTLATAVTAGALTANNTSGSATGSSAVNVTGTGSQGTGGTLGGSGFISGNVTISTPNPANASQGGTIAPGNSPGTLTMTGSSITTWNPLGTYSFDYDATATGTAPLGGGSDLLKGLGTSSLNLNNLGTAAGSQFTLFLNPQGAPTLPASPVTYTIADFSGSTNGTPIVGPAGFSGTNLTPYFSVTGQFNNATTPTVMLSGGNQIQVTFTPVPEPVFILAACGGLTALAGWRRSRRRNIA